MVNFNKIFEETLMVESFENKVLFSVDIQPSAESYIHFNIYEFTNFLNENIDKFKEIVYFFNGPELGFESQSEIEMWLLENELTEDTLDSITFYEKNYGYFRSCMDSGFLNDDLIKLISYMYMNDIVDSRDIDLKKLNIDEELKDFLENDMIYIPDIMEFIGSVSELLKLS